MPDYRYSHIQAIPAPDVERRQTALDLPIGLPEPEPEEPGFLRKNADLASNFAGESLKQIPGALTRYLAHGRG